MISAEDELELLPGDGPDVQQVECSTAAACQLGSLRASLRSLLDSRSRSQACKLLNCKKA